MTIMNQHPYHQQPPPSTTTAPLNNIHHQYHSSNRVLLFCTFILSAVFIITHYASCIHGPSEYTHLKHGDADSSTSSSSYNNTNTDTDSNTPTINDNNNIDSTNTQPRVTLSSSSSSSSSSSEPRALRVEQIDDPIFIKAQQPQPQPNRCIIFSCSPSDYYLLQEHLQAHNVTYCDRKHFIVDTYSTTAANTINTIKPNWCRVAILEQAPSYFNQYDIVLYTDVDTIYNEYEVSHAASTICKHNMSGNLKSLIISKKIEHDKVVLRTNWFLLCDFRSIHVLLFLKKWALMYRDVYLQDQTVFNELTNCNEVHCVDAGKTIELAHCGGYMSREKRLKCMRDRYDQTINDNLSL